MIICKKCGMHNADTDDFCGQCGAFLEWEGERIEPEPAQVAAAPAPVEQEEAKPGFIGRVKAAIGGDVRTEPAEAGTSTIEASPTPPIAPSPVTPVPGAVPPASTAAPVAPSTPPSTEARSDGAPAAPLAPAASEAGPLPARDATTVGPGATAQPAAASPDAEPAPSPAETAAAEAAAAAEAERQAAEAERQAAETAASEEKARRAAGLMARPAVTDPVRSANPAATTASSGAGGGAAATPMAHQPQAVKPAKPVSRPASRRPTERVRTINPGDLICGQCGEGNDPKRNFCRNCGASLKEATVVSIPWWRRIFRRKPKAPVPAGTRPGRGRGGGGGGGAKGTREMPDIGGMFKKLAVVALAILAIVALAVPSVRKSVPRNFNSVLKKFIYHYAPVPITKADAFGSELPGHLAANVFQGDVNSFWASPAPKPGTKVRIRLTFNHPQEVSLIRITSGDPTNFAGSSRPSVLEYLFSDNKAHPPLQIENLQTPQKFKVSSAKAAYVDIVIDSVYPVAGSPYYAAVSRIEVFVKKPGK